MGFAVAATPTAPGCRSGPLSTPRQSFLSRIIAARRNGVMPRQRNGTGQLANQSMSDFIFGLVRFRLNSGRAGVNDVASPASRSGLFFQSGDGMKNGPFLRGQGS
jgi:hypothetical protein